MTGKIYHPEDKHPEPHEKDLNPDANQGLNYGTLGPHPEKGNPTTAFDIKEAHDQFRGYSDDELRRLPIMPAGSRLEQDAVYFDLKHPSRGEIHARGDMSAGPDDLLVPKAEVPYPLWNRLIGVTDPDRLDRAPQG